MKEKQLETLVRVEKDDPKRCQAMANGDQCPMKVYEDSRFCILHGGTPRSVNYDKLYQFKKTKYLQYLSQQIDRFTDSKKSKDISEEIGILRVTLQEVLNKVGDGENGIIYYSSQINQLILNIDKLIQSSLKLDQRVGNLLDRKTVINLAQKLMDAIGEEIENPDTLSKIAERFEKILVEPSNDSTS